MKAAFAGIDLGTTGVRVIVADEDLRREVAGRVNHLCRGPRVEPQLVDDLDLLSPHGVLLLAATADRVDAQPEPWIQHIALELEA